MLNDLIGGNCCLSFGFSCFSLDFKLSFVSLSLGHFEHDSNKVDSGALVAVDMFCTAGFR